MGVSFPTIPQVCLGMNPLISAFKTTSSLGFATSAAAVSNRFKNSFNDSSAPWKRFDNDITSFESAVCKRNCSRNFHDNSAKDDIALGGSRVSHVVATPSRKIEKQRHQTLKQSPYVIHTSSSVALDLSFHQRIVGITNLH